MRCNSFDVFEKDWNAERSEFVFVWLFGSECSEGILEYILARGMDLWRRGVNTLHGNGNMELPLRATSSLTRRAIPEPLKVPPDRD